MSFNLPLLFSCPLSQQPHPLFEEPVQDPCGHIFERRHIVDYIGIFHKCPFNDRLLNSSQLSPVRYTILSAIAILRGSTHPFAETTLEHFEGNNKENLIRASLEIQMTTGMIDLKELFSCPFSRKPYTLLSEPVKDSCGHIFEKKSIEWYVQQYHQCPLNKDRPLQSSNLKSSPLQGLQVLRQRPQVLENNSLIGLADECIEHILSAAKIILLQRHMDQGLPVPIPTRVPETILQQIGDAMKSAVMISSESYKVCC